MHSSHSPASEQRNRIKTPGSNTPSPISPGNLGAKRHFHGASSSPSSPHAPLLSTSPHHHKKLSHHSHTLEKKIKRKLSSQVIYEFKDHLKEYVLAIESALGHALLEQRMRHQDVHDNSAHTAAPPTIGRTSSSSLLYEAALSEHQKQCKDNLYLSVDLLIQKLKFAEDEISLVQEQNNDLKMQLQRTRQREQDLIRRIDDIAHLDSASNDHAAGSGSETNDSEEEIELSSVLDSYQTDFAETKRKLKLVEKRLKFYEVLKSQKPKKSEDLEKLDIPKDLLEQFGVDSSSDEKDTSHQERQAPTENMTLIFVDLRGSTALWEAASEQMFQSILMYHSETRRLCKKYKIYEAKSDGDGFMCLAADVKNAVLFCLELQEALLEAEWPKELLKSKGAQIVRMPDNDKVLFRGLTARCGCHFSVSPKTIVDPVTGRTDVFGSDVNLCARLEQYANPGELAISNDVYQLIKGELKKLQSNNKLAMADRGGIKLKGIEQPEHVRALVPWSLRERLDLYEDTGTPAECESPTATDSVKQLQFEQKKLLGEVEIMKQRIMTKLKTASEKNIKNARVNFVQQVREMTRDPTSFDIDSIITALKKYQTAMKKQEKELESCSHKVDDMAESEDDEQHKREATVKRIKKLKKKAKRRQGSSSQLTADIHKSTLSQQLKTKVDKTLQSELHESRAHVTHLKNEVAILRRALKSKSHRSNGGDRGGSDTQCSPYATSSPMSFPQSHSYPTSMVQSHSFPHSPTSPTTLGGSPSSSYQMSGFSSYSNSPMTPTASPPAHDATSHRLQKKPTSSASVSGSGALFVKLPHIHSSHGTGVSPKNNEAPTLSKNPVEMLAARSRTRKRSQSMVVPSRGPVKDRVGASPLG